MPYALSAGLGLIVVTIDNTASDSVDSIRFGVELTDAENFLPANFNTLANTIRDRIKAAYDSGWNIGPCKINFVNSSGELVYEDTTTEAGTGAAATYAPPAVSWIISKKTPFVGKRNRGRMYMPGVIETEVDENGHLSSTYVADLQVVASGLLSDVVASAFVNAMVILHDEGTPPSAAPDVNALLVRNIVGTQRPRQRRRIA